MFKNEHDLFMPVLFDTCLCYDSCQSSFKWEAVCCKQITLLSMKGEKQPKTLVGLSTERVRIQASLNSEFPGCFLWKRLCSHTSQWYKAVNSGKVGWHNCALGAWEAPKSLRSPTKSLYSWWILSITVVFPVCRQGVGVLSTVYTRAVLGEFRGSSWRDFSWMFWTHVPNPPAG